MWEMVWSWNGFLEAYMCECERWGGVAVTSLRHTYVNVGDGADLE